MTSLLAASDKPIRAQIAESVSLIAREDFPDNWPDLLDVRAVPPSPLPR
jgi:exportin-2 (importin alpha re-exporter)